MFKHIYIKIFFIILFIYKTDSQLCAQVNTAYGYEVKAAFLYNFTKFITWPEEAFTGESDPFIIGILGPDPFNNYLNDIIRGESVGRHPIEVKIFDNLSEITNCQMLYINSDNDENIRQALQMLKNKNVLTVSEYVFFSRLGGHVKFYNENNKIKFQVNPGAVKNSRLTISSKLLNLAKIY